jgi:DNA polymerase III delta prime subunit
MAATVLTTVLTTLFTALTTVLTALLTALVKELNRPAFAAVRPKMENATSRTRLFLSNPLLSMISPPAQSISADIPAGII